MVSFFFVGTKKGEGKKIGALVLTSFIWGVTFVAQSIGAEDIDAYTFMAGRSVLSFVFVMLKYALRHMLTGAGKGLVAPINDKGLIRAAGTSGFFLCVASILQQVGIAHTTTAKASFITTLYVIIVPVIASLFLKKKQGLGIWISVMLGVAGLYLLSMSGRVTLSFGDGIILLSAFVYAGQILVIDHFASGFDTICYSAVQFFVCSVMSGVMVIFFSDHDASAFIRAFPYVAFAGIFSGGIAYTLQIYGQKGTNPTIASLIMCLESVFGAIAGFVILHQALSARELLGCALMFLAIVLAQILPGRKV